MSRVLRVVALCTGILLPCASDAFAHGGIFRGPGGAVPPHLREPTDPTPPPPPPPTTGAPTPTPSEPGLPTPKPPPPVTPGGGPPAPQPPMTGPEGGPARPKPSTLDFSNWVFWWGYNNDDILRIKEAIYAMRASAGTTLGELGGTSGASTDVHRPVQKQVREVMVPALLWAMDPAARQPADVEAAAYLALAKVTDEPSHADRLARGVYVGGEPAGRDPMVAESAALSLGLLRRSDATRRLSDSELDRVRDLLFRMFEDDRLKSGRTQGFAMLAIGLLGDQPTARSAASPQPTAAARIVDLLHRRYANADLPVALMLALSLQSHETIEAEWLPALKDCALRGRLFGQPASDLLSSYAALALGRLGTAEHAGAMLTAMTGRGPLPVRRSAAIAVGSLGCKAMGSERAEIASRLLRTIQDAKDDSTRNFGTISLAYLLAADVGASRTDVLDAKGKPGKFLLDAACGGRFDHRPFAALALGLVARRIGERPALLEHGEFRLQATDVLRAGLANDHVDKRTRGAYAIGLGLIGDGGSRRTLEAMVADPGEDKELRGYSAVALGMIGGAPIQTVRTLRRAMTEPSSEELRLQAAVALGLLSVPDAVPALLEELEAADSQNVRGQIAVALARIGDSRAVQPLVDLLRSDQAEGTRALACAALGMIGDIEALPSLSRLSKDLNYRAAPDLINEVLSIF